MLFDYEILRIIWWILLGILLIGFAVMDGFDLGTGILLHCIAKTNDERRTVLNTVGPIWEGNQIWLILGAGAIFAAWPAVYAISFSGFYFAMLLVLFALILRPLGFKYRAKIDCRYWRTIWDMALFVGGFVPALIFGVAIGNLLQGVPFYFDADLRAFYTGNLLGLLNPFGLLCGLVSVLMLALHGATFLCIKTEYKVLERARRYGRFSGILFLLCFCLAGYFIAFHISGYTLLSSISPIQPSNPLHKEVILKIGAWMQNYHQHHFYLIIPMLGIIGALLSVLFLSFRHYKFAWAASSLGIAGTIGTVGVSMFPFIMPSSSHPNMSLLLWDASSSETTLFIMLIATVIFMPIVLIYTSWIYHVMRGKTDIKIY